MSEQRGGRDEALRLLGIKEAAALLGTAPTEVRDWIELGWLPCVRVGVTQEPRVSAAMILAWQEGRIGKMTAGQIAAKYRKPRGAQDGRESPSVRSHLRPLGF